MSLLRIDRFAKGVIFAALAALAAVVGVVVLGPVAGVGGAISAVFGGLALAWLFCIAPRAAAGFKTVLFAGPLVAMGVLAMPHPTLIAVAATALIAVTRGVFFDEGSPARSTVVEVAVAAGALALASVFVPGGLTGLGLAVWAFFLVQSLPLLTAAAEPSPKAGGEGAFTAAMTRAERILDR